MNAVAVRALLRIGARGIRRSPWRSVLVALLVALPVAGMVGATTVLRTVTPSSERIVTHRMGQADLIVDAGSGGTGDLLRSKLPSGSIVEPFIATAASLVLPGMEISVNLESHDPEGLGRGMLSLVDGRWPNAPREAAISRELGRVAKVGIGDTVQVRELESVRIVGFLEDELGLTTRILFVGPDVARQAEAAGQAEWLVGLPTGTTPDSLDLGTPVHVTGPPPPVDPNAPFFITTRSFATEESSGVGPATLILGALALVNATLIAAAAFSVSVRRRQREFGLLSAAGAEPRHLAATVVAEALVLGGAGAVVGIVLGIGGSLAIKPFLDGLTGHRNPGLALDLLALVIAAAMGLIAALVASLGPALGAARLPVLAALAGRRPPASSGRRAVLAAAVLVAAAVALTALGAALRLAHAGSSLSTVLLVFGAVLGTLGFGAGTPWLLAQSERLASRLPLAGRIGIRDLARARARNGSLVTALLAAFAATVAIASYQASVDASNAASWKPFLFADQIMVDGSGATQAGSAALTQLGGVAGATIPGTIGDKGGGVWISAAGSNDPNSAIATQYVVVGTPEVVAALGVKGLDAALGAGKLVLLSEKARQVSEVRIHLIDSSTGEDVRASDLPATVIATGLQMDEFPGAVIAPKTAASLGLRPADAGIASRYLLRLDHAATETDVARVASIAAGYPDTVAFGGAQPAVAGAGFRWVLIFVSLLFALGVTAIAVALGEAESRPEQRTLLAVGADARVRRRIAAARAGGIAVLGGALAIPAGLLPVWGLLASRGAPLVVPWPEVVGAIALLPILAIAGTWLLSRPIPDWSAFRNVGA